MTRYSYLFKFAVGGDPSMLDVRRYEPDRRLTPPEAWHEAKLLGEAERLGPPRVVVEVSATETNLSRPEEG